MHRFAFMPQRLLSAVFAGILLAASTSAPTAAQTSASEGCVRAADGEIERLHERWNTSLQTMHPDRVLRNYAHDASLIGLDASDVRDGFLGVRDYYVYFLQREPTATLGAHVVRSGCNRLTMQGVMSVLLRPKAKQPHETVPVRVSVTYEFAGGHWLITQHHMSVVEISEAAEQIAAARTQSKAPVVAGFLKRKPSAATAAPTTAAKPAAAPSTPAKSGPWSEFSTSP
jgi:uncharacterized protein (TIGR02246 family)